MNLRKTIKTISLLTLWAVLLPNTTFGQASLNQKENDLLIKLAEETIESFESYLRFLGNPNRSAGEKKEIIENTIFKDYIPNKSTRFSNDLDPIGTHPSELDIDAYLHNLQVDYFPPSKGGVNIEFLEINAVDQVYQGQNVGDYFVKVVVNRRLKGKFESGENRRTVDNTKKLDYYVRVTENKKPLNFPEIYSMNFHQDNSTGFTPISILNSSASIFSSEEISTIEDHIQELNDDIRTKMGNIEDQIDALNKKIDQGGFDYYNEKIKLDKERYNLQLRKQKFSNDSSSFYLQKQNFEREMRTRRNAVNSKESNLRAEARRLDARENSLRRKEIRYQNKNRLALKFGGGGGILLGPNYHQNFSSSPLPTSGFGEADLWWRLTPIAFTKKKGKPKSNLALVIFGRYGIMRDWGVKGIVDGAGNGKVKLGSDGSFWDLEAGFGITDLLRISAGLGEINYKNIQDGNNIQKFYSGSLGFYTRRIKKFIQPGLILNIKTLELPSSPIFWEDIPTHPSASIVLLLQID